MDYKSSAMREAHIVVNVAFGAFPASKWPPVNVQHTQCDETSGGGERSEAKKVVKEGVKPHTHRLTLQVES